MPLGNLIRRKDRFYYSVSTTVPLIYVTVVSMKNSATINTNESEGVHQTEKKRMFLKNFSINRQISVFKI